MDLITRKYEDAEYRRLLAICLIARTPPEIMSTVLYDLLEIGVVRMNGRLDRIAKWIWGSQKVHASILKIKLEAGTIRHLWTTVMAGMCDQDMDLEEFKLFDEVLRHHGWVPTQKF